MAVIAATDTESIEWAVQGATDAAIWNTAKTIADRAGVTCMEARRALDAMNARGDVARGYGKETFGKRSWTTIVWRLG